jgi:hypothetical protein
MISEPYHSISASRGARGRVKFITHSIDPWANGVLSTFFYQLALLSQKPSPETLLVWKSFIFTLTRHHQSLKMGSLEATAERHDLSFASLRELYHAEKATPIDVVNQIYDHIESYPDKAVWIHLVPRQTALEAASLLISKYVEQRPLPTLYGIPFSVKDSIDVAGIPTTQSNRARSSEDPGRRRNSSW